MTTAAESIIVALERQLERVCGARCVEIVHVHEQLAALDARRSSPTIAALDRTDKIAVLATMTRLERALMRHVSPEAA